MNQIGGPATLPRLRRIQDAAGFRRRLRQLRYLVFHRAAHLHYSKRINQLVDRGLVMNGVFQRYKYLGDYIARSLSRQTRRAMILSHYHFVEPRVSSSACRLMMGDGLQLWNRFVDDHQFTIRLMTNRFAPMEGEWQLQFTLDNAVICTLSFLFASLPPFAAGDEVVCLLGGMQGGQDCRLAIRTASKAHDEIYPTAMLVMAVKAVAHALGVEAVFGVSSNERIVGLYAGDRLFADYDAIWAGEGASRVVGGFYALSRDLIERPLSDIPRSHRRRTKHKRQRKAEIMVTLIAAAVSQLGIREAVGHFKAVT